MKPFTKDEYRAAKKFKTEWVPLPHLGEDRGMYVRALSGKERDEFEAATSKLGEVDARLSNLRARYTALCASDESGQRLFTDDDAGWLGDEAGGALTLDMVYDGGRKLNRMFMTESELKDAEKNFGARPGVSFASGSPANLDAPT